MNKKLEASRKQASKELREDAIAGKYPHKKIHGYDVYFEGNDKEGWNCFCPTLLGCCSAGDTLTSCKNNMAEAIEMHLEGMAEDGLEISPKD